jgi:hypothetical protein
MAGSFRKAQDHDKNLSDSSTVPLASAEEQKFFFTPCRIPLPPFVVIVKPGNLPA